MVEVNRQLRWLFKAQRGSGGFKASYEAVTVREQDDRDWKITWTDPTQVKTLWEDVPGWDVALGVAVDEAQERGFELEEVEVQDQDLTEFVSREW